MVWGKGIEHCIALDRTVPDKQIPLFKHLLLKSSLSYLLILDVPGTELNTGTPFIKPFHRLLRFISLYGILFWHFRLLPFTVRQSGGTVDKRLQIFLLMICLLPNFLPLSAAVRLWL